MGEIQLAVRFACSSLFNTLAMYSQPLLPTMHYLHPLTYYQIDNLRHWATQIIATRLGRAEPPLRREVVEIDSFLQMVQWDLRLEEPFCNSVSAHHILSIRVLPEDNFKQHVRRCFDRDMELKNEAKKATTHGYQVVRS
ncbi:hypothetical protein RND71_001509 [Anisodus tanguticus]|uniref:Uncharacterized protein n=1 Tax=Anisodus tanguticus TaxID=243964 RepID=A0AAE1T114_9SOLA|nr:hypothetical protein RND71_001509 [Anisodus tanguticus]